MLESFLSSTLALLQKSPVDTILVFCMLFYMLLGLLRGFGRTFTYTFLFFVGSVFGLWWFTPYLKTFNVGQVPELLVNMFYFWLGNTTLAFIGTKIVMALDSNGTGFTSRIGGMLMGGIYAVMLLFIVNISYVIALPNEDRIENLPAPLNTSKVLQKSDASAKRIYNGLEKAGIIDALTSRELPEEPEEETEAPQEEPSSSFL